MKYCTVVDCTEKQLYKYGKTLKRYGLRNYGSQYIGYLSRRKYEKVREYCQSRYIKIKIDNGYGDRSNNYRSVYFKNNKPFIGNRYCCAYCGRILPKNKITIDHIYPINQVKSSVRLQKHLKRHGIDNVNSEKNLAPACSRCNKMKSDKMGYWIIQGKIGRIQSLWKVRWFIRVVTFFILMLYFMSKFLQLYI